MAMPATAEEMFNTRVPEVLARTKPRVGMVYLIKVPGVGGGEWTLDLISPEPSCKAGNVGGARCTITMSYDHMRQIMLQPAVATQLYFQGKVKVEGDITAVIKLQPFFSALA